MFKKQLDRGEAGDNVGALLRGVKREDVQRGQILAAPGTVPTKTKFEAEVYVLTKEEGGRHTPFFANYRPQFFIRTADVTGHRVATEGTEMVMPGDNATLHIELIAPVALTEGLRFALREGGKTVGAGVVSKITGWVYDARNCAFLPNPRREGHGPGAQQWGGGAGVRSRSPLAAVAGGCADTGAPPPRSSSSIKQTKKRGNRIASPASVGPSDAAKQNRRV